MAIVNENFVYQVRVHGLADGQRILNVLSYRFQDDVGATVSTTMGFLLAFRTRWRSTFLTVLPSQYSVERYELIEIIGRTRNEEPNPPAPLDPLERDLRYGFGEEIPGEALDEGSLIGDTLPTSVALNVSKRTLLRGRGSRGSMRIGPIREADTNFNEVTNGYRDTVQTVADAFRPDISTVADEYFKLVIHNLTAFLTAPPSGSVTSAFTTDVSGLIVRQILTTQRSRKKRTVGAL